jgi:type II secretory pathway component PulF
MAPKRDWVPVLAWAVAAFLASIAFYLLMFALPKFVALFQEMGVREFPLPTLLAMHVRRFLASKLRIVALALVALFALGRTKTGRRWQEQLLGRRAQTYAPIIAACLGVVAVPVVALATFLPLVTVTGQVAAP